MTTEVFALLAVAAAAAIVLAACAAWDYLAGWWHAARRDLSDLLRERLGSEDVYAEDRAAWVGMDFTDIASTMPELAALDRALAGLYLASEEPT